MRARKIWVNLSYHGYGHLAQTAPVLDALYAQVPNLSIILQTEAPDAVLDKFFFFPYTKYANPYDIGMVMLDAFRLDVAATWRAYRAFHAQWRGLLQQARAQLAAEQPDVLLSNIAYLPIVAAQQLDIPSVAMCSLHWGDILKGYCTGRQDEQEIIRHIEHSYRQAALFLQPTPSMPMLSLHNRRGIGPIARVGEKFDVKAALGLHASDRLLLINLGGVETQLAFEYWPTLKNVYWLNAQATGQRDDVLTWEAINRPYPDVLCSCDGMLTKPGYGNFCDAACHGLRVLYGEKPDWPESIHLQTWLHQVAVAQAVDAKDLLHGQFEQALNALFAMPEKPGLKMTGITQARDILCDYLR